MSRNTTENYISKHFVGARGRGSILIDFGKAKPLKQVLKIVRQKRKFFETQVTVITHQSKAHNKPN